jgi:hypothetical protein
MRHGNFAKQIAAIQAAIEAQSGEFMEYGRELIELREAAKAAGRSLGSIMGEANVPRRKIYSVINAVETAQKLKLTDAMASKIGWSKLAILSASLTGDRDTDDALVEMAITCTQATLRGRISHASKGPVRIVQLALTSGLSRRFEKALSAISGQDRTTPATRGKLVVQVLESCVQTPVRRTKPRAKKLKAA